MTFKYWYPVNFTGLREQENCISISPRLDPYIFEIIHPKLTGHWETE
jgi:hypothetical protein